VREATATIKRAGAARFLEVAYLVPAARAAVIRTAVAILPCTTFFVAAEVCHGLVLMHIEALVALTRYLPILIQAVVAAFRSLLVGLVPGVDLRQFAGSPISGYDGVNSFNQFRGVAIAPVRRPA